MKGLKVKTVRPPSNLLQNVSLFLQPSTTVLLVTSHKKSQKSIHRKPGHTSSVVTHRGEVINA